MRILIVDDERPARERLLHLLAQTTQSDTATELAQAADGFEALATIGTFAPDVVFLDIQMPQFSGLELAASLPEPAPLIVFVTAFDHYAIAAFDANAVDYLHKPFDAVRLARALDRVQMRLLQRAALKSETGARARTAIALQPQTCLAQLGRPIAQLLVSDRGITRVVRVQDIQWIESADNYVVLHTANGQPLLRQTLTQLVTTLGERFMRCHRRAAVQLSWVRAVVHRDNGDCTLIMRDAADGPTHPRTNASGLPTAASNPVAARKTASVNPPCVPCSRQYRADVFEKLKALIP